MSPDSSELLHLHYRPDLALLVGRWGYQPDATLLPAAYEQLAQAAVHYQSSCWLQDIRRRTLNDPATTRWLLTDYFPDIVRRLGRPLAVAYLTSPTLMTHILGGPDYQPPAAYTGQPFTIGFFSDEGEAVAWLREQPGC